MLRRMKMGLLFIILNVSYFLISDVSAKKVRSDDKIVIHKCCPNNQVVVVDLYSDEINNCTEYGMPLPTFDKAIYDKDVHDKLVQKLFSDVYRVVVNETPSYDFLTQYIVADNYGWNSYLNDNGSLYLEYPNAYDRWQELDTSNICFDYELNGSLIQQPKFWCYLPPSDGQAKSEILFTIALLISSFFLFLVLVVYALLPGLRNLCGLVLMAYVVSLFFAFVFLASIQLGEPGTEGCIRLTTCTYFFFLASFCWMNVMSYDIWWTFRGYAKARPIHRRGEKFKFGMYCIYAWGVPLAMSIAMLEMNQADLRHMPWIVKPLIPDLGCFMEGGQKLVYLYAPMLVLIICNWIFYLMTAFNIWRLNRSTAVLDSAAAGTPAAHRSQRQRLLVYLKLSIIMGVNWLLEVVSSLSPDLMIWNFTDAYNLLIGLSIFLIFVCKIKIYRQLKARFARDQPGRVLAKCNTSSSTLSNSSQDTTLQVYSHPNGVANNKQKLNSETQHL